jgi:hypothetical protein
MKIKIKEADELDHTTQYFTTSIQEAARYSTPAPPDKTNNTYNIPLHIRELVTEKVEQEMGGKTQETMMAESFTTDSNDDCTIRWQIQET